MPGRKFSGGGYRYGFNGTEKAPEISEGHNITFFRQQDTRIARRWSIDPKIREFESPYAMIGNNPILYHDLLGDTTRVYNLEGVLLQTINDTHQNQEHFMSSESHQKLFENESYASLDVNGRGNVLRGSSEFYIGSNTRNQLESVAASAKGDGKEREFVFFTVKNSRELEVYDITDEHVQDTDRGIRGIKVTESKASYILSSPDAITGQEGSIIQGAGHVHTVRGLSFGLSRIPVTLNNLNSPTIIDGVYAVKWCSAAVPIQGAPPHKARPARRLCPLPPHYF